MQHPEELHRRFGVLKELIQNADDAGATKVRFLYDERRNEDAQTILIDKGMKELQGPALWAYNDKVFTQHDFDSFVKLSAATKEHNQGKIGRFGLGFNAVYNLTDVPSLVSQNYIVFLDPHTKHLGNAIRDKSRPGIRLNFKTNTKQIQQLTDQFKPFNGIFGCDFGSEMKTSYPATLFRFPLRTREQAASSEICKQHYSNEEMINLLQLLAKSSNNLLLFTQHVRKITICHLPSESTSPTQMNKWFTVEKKIENIFRSICPTGSGDSHLDSAILEAATDDCHYLESAILEAATNLKFDNKFSKNDKHNLESSVFLTISTEVSPEVQAIFEAKNTTEENYWLVASCTGKDQALEMACQESDLIAVGGVAAQFYKSADGFKAISLASNDTMRGIMFCFLPLPIKTCFPVHINGFFAVTSSRMHIFEKDNLDKTDKRALWNEALIKDAIMQAYAILLADSAKLCANSMELWPTHKSVKESGILAHLTEYLYYCIVSDANIKVIQSNEKLIAISECKMLERTF